MRLTREISGVGSRPYPLDRERRRLVLVALAEQDLSISKLAQKLGLSRTLISYVISGRRRTVEEGKRCITEQRIADFLGKAVDDLFPIRLYKEIAKMRQAEAAQKGRTA